MKITFDSCRAAKASHLYLLISSVFAALLLCTPTPSRADTTELKSKKEIHVHVVSQTLVALDNSKEIYNFDIVTGQPGKETTLGRYAVSRKHEQYTSKAYGSEMPYTMFFTSDGKAIHGTSVATLRSYIHSYVSESVGSKGCVGLTDDHAKALFEWAPVGTPVIVQE